MPPFRAPLFVPWGESTAAEKPLAVAPPQEVPGIEQRRRLLLFNQERIEFAYEKAKADGTDDPVVVCSIFRTSEPAGWPNGRACLGH